MKAISFIFLSLLLLLAPFCGYSSDVVELRCENQTLPLGVDSESPIFSWKIQSNINSTFQSDYRIIVSDNIRDVERGKANVWDSRRVETEQSLNISYGGEKLASGKRYYWRVKVWDNHGKESKWSSVGQFRMGLLKPEDWSGAKWIAMDEISASERIVPGFQLAGYGGKIVPLNQELERMPLFRKSFNTNKKVCSATMYVCGLGHFELHVNGMKMGDNILDPGWTNYDKTSLYVTFDVTDKILKGENVIAVRLGNGFLNIPRDATRYRKLLTTFSLPKMLCKAVVEYTDGSVETILSDTDWKVTPGHVTYSSIYGGEDYDATLITKGWDEPGFDDSSWQTPLIIDAVGTLKSQTAPAIKVNRTIKHVEITELTNGVFIYDFGQNAASIPALKVSGKRGSKVVIRPGEYLTADGKDVNQNNSGTPFRYSYTLSGDGVEQWHPAFTYYGFRFLRVEGAVPDGYPNPHNLPVIESLESLHISSSSSVTGSFTCSNKLFNDIYSLIDWSVRSNMVSVITDCPHRERLGWLEVSHLMGSSIAYCYDIKQLLLKTIDDMKDSQRGEGLIPSTAPEYAVFGGDFSDSPEWGSAGVILPWFIYERYGDISVLRDSYDLMVKYTSYLSSTAQEHIIYHGLGDWYDLGPNHPGWSQLTTRGLTPTAIYYYDLTVMAKTATLLEKSTDARKYAELAAKVKEAFNKKFFNQDKGYYDTGSQTANAMPIYVGLCEAQNHESVRKRIIEDIRSRGNSITSGDIGFRYLLRVLESTNASDIIFDMNNQSEKPGYGYQLKKGATSLTESWEALQTASHNHCMLGHLMEWFYSGLGGIRTSEGSLAFKRFILHPEIVGDVNSVKCSFDSPYGKIESSWRLLDGMFEYDVAIPVNTTAEIYIPAVLPDQITVNGESIDKANKYNIEVHDVITKDGKRVLTAGSGRYTIRCPYLIK